MNSNKYKKHQGVLLIPRATQKKLQNPVATVEKDKQRLVALSIISDLITQSLEIRHALTIVTKNVMELMNVDAIRVYLLDDGGQGLSLEVSNGISEKFTTEVSRLKIGEGFNGMVAEMGRPLVIQDTAKYPVQRGQVVAEGIRSQLIVPMQSKGKVVGTLCVSKHTLKKFYRADVELLGSIGNQIGAGLENARLYQDMEKTLRQLQQSEERYRDLFENASDAIWLHDLEGNMLAANTACVNVTQYSSEQLQSVCIDEMMSDVSKLRITKIEQKLLRSEVVDNRCEVELLKKDGTKALVQVTTSLIAHDGRAVAFQHSARDVTDERKLQENLRYYLQQVTRAQEEERKRIARELHDGTLQSLIAISRQLEKITSSDALWEMSLEVVRNLRKQIEAAVQEMRRFSHDLRPSVLDDLGLLPTLELLMDDLNEQGIATSFKVIGEAGRFASEVEVMLFRIAQEALRNISRHAQASAAELVIEFRGAIVILSISDNGRGFTLPQSVGDLASLGKLGLTGMQERARLLSGSLMVESRPGKGTVVTAEVPT